MKTLFFVSLILLSSVQIWAKVRYDNYKVYRVIPKTLDEISRLRQLERSELNLNFWKISTGKFTPTDIVVAPHVEPELQHILQHLGIHHGVMIENLQRLIDESRPKLEARREFGWDDYYNLTEIYDWLDSQVDNYPENAKIVIGGHSYEGRQIKGIKLSFQENRKGMFIEGGIHAREWISPAVVTYFINELLTSQDPQVRYVAESYDWYIFPSVNPDGYEYTHTTDRLWRMTRQPHGMCIGADPNRNWGYHWNEGGTSNSSCDETYAGPYPFSEPETKTLSEFITKIHKNLVGYLSFHSYSQLLLIPYGYNNAHVENHKELMAIGQKAIDSLRERYGTKYTVGNMAETIYVASGVSPDWVKGNFKLPLTYTYELRDTGRHGFILPPSQIIPTAEETMDSLLTMMLEAKKYGYA